MTSLSIEHWNCEICKAYNDILTNHCKSCYSDKPSFVTTEYQISVEFKRGIYFGYGILGVPNSMTPEELKFKEFFADEVIFIKDMDITQLREHRQTLAAIAFEAKARTVATDDALREKQSKTKNKQFLITVDQSDTDAINAPKIRAARMSKIDKMREQYLSAGIDEATVNEMIRNLERKGTEDNLKTIAKKELEPVKANPFAFTSQKPQVIEEKINDVKVPHVEQTEREIQSAKPNPFSSFGKQ